MEVSDKIRTHWILRASEADGEQSTLEQAGESLDESLCPYEPSDEERDKHAHARFEPLTILMATSGTRRSLAQLFSKASRMGLFCMESVRSIGPIWGHSVDEPERAPRESPQSARCSAP